MDQFEILIKREEAKARKMAEKIGMRPRQDPKRKII
jgi:hypothetical protein